RSARTTRRRGECGAGRARSEACRRARSVSSRAIPIAGGEGVLVLLEEVELLGGGEHRELLALPVARDRSEERQLLRAAKEKIVDEAGDHPRRTGDAADRVG